MSDDSNKSRFTQIGTVECALMCALVALLAAIGFITIGFWKTLLIVALVAVGLFIGGVRDKRAFFQDLANKLPSRGPVAYKADDVKKIRSLKDIKDAEEAAGEAQEEAVQQEEKPADEDAGDIVEELEEAKETLKEAVEETRETAAQDSVEPDKGPEGSETAAAPDENK